MCRVGKAANHSQELDSAIRVLASRLQWSRPDISSAWRDAPDKPLPSGESSTKQRTTVMLRKVELEPRHASFLSSYRLPALSWDNQDLPYSSLKPVWEGLNENHTTEARTIAQEATQERRIFPPEERAALYASLAAAELELGATDTAKRLAGKSLDLHPNQYMAHRILLTVHVIRKDFTAAYLHLANLPLPNKTSRWDCVLTHQDVQTALAAWAWQLGEWDQVADHLMMAYPGGLSEMPADIREDWFKLSLYRGLADDAAAAAASIVDTVSESEADDILQTIVQSGWTGHALPLYQQMYAQNQDSELIRRRIVALCIKEGQMDEARKLAMSAPLKLAA